jgi:16S rRNA (uracil1498-N3)-methyltransferase
LNPLIAIKKFVDDVESQQPQKFIAHCQPSNKLFFSTEVNKNLDCLMLIGPEGDFNAQEIDHALNNGFVPVSLGDARLRTETAGVYTASVFNC